MDDWTAVLCRLFVVSPGHGPSVGAMYGRSEQRGEVGQRSADASADASAEALDDKQLMQRIVRGDETAFAQLIGRYQGRVLGHLTRMLGPHDAEDVAQNTFLRIWRSSARYDPRFSCASWILVVASRLALNHLRDRRPWRLPSLEDCGEVAVHDRAPGAPLEESDERSHLQARLEAALAALPAHARLLYELRYRQECSIDEIAVHFACQPNAVKQRLHRLKQNLVDQVGGGTHHA